MEEPRTIPFRQKINAVPPTTAIAYLFTVYADSKVKL